MLVPGLLFGAAIVWNSSYEATPASSDPVAQGDDRLREAHEAIRARSEVEHWWGGNSGADDNGLHRVGSGRCYVATGTGPTILIDSRADYDNTGGAGETTLQDSATNSGGAIADDVGHGRCWIDTDGADDVAGTDDDNQLNFFLGVAGDSNGAWTAVTDGSIGGLTAAGNNLVYNGSFEVTDGGGATGSTTIPIGWAEDSGTPTYAYTTPPSEATEGEGVQLDMTGAVASPSGIKQTLTNLKASTTYYVVARVDVNSGDTCRLITSGASTNLSAQDSTATSYATLSGTFVTAAALDTVDIQLLAVTAGDVCHWDHVGVYEQNIARVPQAGRARCFDSSTATTANLFSDGSFVDSGDLSCTINVPGPGYMIVVNAALVGENDAAARHIFVARLMENVNGGGAAEVRNSMGLVDNSGADCGDTAIINLNFTREIPTPGSQYVFTIEGAGIGAVFDYGDEDADCLGTQTSYVEAFLIPTR